MGVPKFYRWISERYPTLSEVISDSQIPEFDNLYLDMNGIIHNCSHPNDDDVTFRISEEQIFADIFNYIEKLFNIIRPKKVFYLAVDGVAPRAKMNQQRARRFMSARTAQEQLEKAIKKGEVIPDEKRFDSNCITPGTPFMTRLHEELQKLISAKINSDSKWQGIRIILSGHNVPGEGEHKIMDFIRAERAEDGYNPNTRHCMYGLDADLIMLGLCSHEPHFSLLREEVKFGRGPRPKKKDENKKEEKKAPPPPSESTFHLLHLSLMREYLYWEFHSLKDKISFGYDAERIIDDWILMGFLVGNDFIPHLPHVHIHDDGLPYLYDSYRKVLPMLDGYINEAGYLNLERFEKFLKAVAENDKDHFIKMIDDEQFLQSKRTQKGETALAGMYDELIEERTEEELVTFQDSDMSSCSAEDDEEQEADTGDAAFISSDEDEEDDSEKKTFSSDTGIQSASDALASMSVDNPAETEFAHQMALAEFAPMDDKEFESHAAACWSRTIGNSFKKHKKAYYKDKMKYGNITKEQLRAQSEGYVRAIQWVLHYYYHGCVSWNWYFEHHYAPYISDVTDFSSMEMNFELSKPFKPFEQLLAVLPAASSDCLPPVLRELMTSTSEIADFYPTEFKTDLNGKKNDWEAVVLIPFIDEKRFLEAIRSKEKLLSSEEMKRNSQGPHILFTTDPAGAYGQKAKITLLNMDKFRIPKEKIVWGLLSNVKLDVFFPGFPTMKHLPHTGVLKAVNVCVFNQVSKKPSMVLTIGQREDQEGELSNVAMDLIGKEVCVEWPVLKMGKVYHIESLTHRYLSGPGGTFNVEELTPDEEKLVAKKLREIKERQLTRYAIDCSAAKAIVYVKRFMGVKYEAIDEMLIPRKQYGGLEDAMIVPLNLVVTNIRIEEGKRFQEISVEKAYPPKARVFVMSPNVDAFGFPCLVDRVEDPGTEKCRVRIMCAIPNQPDFSVIKSNPSAYSLPWYDGYSASKQSGIGNKLLGRITGTVYLIDGDEKEAETAPKVNIGVNLKFSKRNLEVPNYSRRTKENYWQYSYPTLQLLADYRTNFPEIFAHLERSTSYNDVYYAADIWSDEKIRETRLKELKEYLISLPTANIEKQEAGMKTVDSLLLSKIEATLKRVPPSVKMFKGSVSPNLIYAPDLYDGKVRPDPEADFELLDRVVNTVSGTVDFGMMGTIIGIMKDRLEVLFDKEFKAGYKKGEMASVAHVPYSSVINITYGKERKNKPKPLTPPPSTSTPRLAAGRDIAPSQMKEKKPLKKDKVRTVEKGKFQRTIERKADVVKSYFPPEREKQQHTPRNVLKHNDIEEKQKVQEQLTSLLGLNKKKEEEKEAPSSSSASVMRILTGKDRELKYNVPHQMNHTPPAPSNAGFSTTFSSTAVILSSKVTSSAISSSMIPTSNVDPMKVTDLKPSTMAFKRGGGREGRGRHLNTGQRSSTSNHQVKSSSPASSSVQKEQKSVKKERRSRLAATFPTA